MLMNNSVFGKTQENLRNRVSAELITDASSVELGVQRPKQTRTPTSALFLTSHLHQHFFCDASTP